MKEMTLVTLPAASELFQRELEKVVLNIQDPNTSAKTKRSITLTVAFIPQKNDRQSMALDVSADSKLAPQEGHSTLAYVGMKDSKPVAYANDPRQQEMFDGEEEDPDVVDIHSKEKEKEA